MVAPAAPVTVALLAVPGCSSAATLYGLYDALAGTRRDWQRLHGCGGAESPLRPLIVTRDGGATVLANGLPVLPGAACADVPRPDAVCITDLQLPPDEPLDGRFDAEVDWLRAVHARGATLASACSGALLLARTGLLDGLDATSHWAYCDILRRRHPTIRWRPERGLVLAGPGQRLLMAGSGVTWHLLALALIARFASPEEAMQVARVKLFDIHAAPPQAYASLSRGGVVADAVVAAGQRWAGEHYALGSPVTRMVAHSGLPERSFKRRFTQATGMSPLEYVHALRLEEAKRRLEAGDEPVEAIALEVGYQDASFFGRLFHRRTGLTPAQYRRRFGALRRALTGAARPAE